jgi:prepilin-type N-terminal cleavage/methylation domain-containing protein
MRLVTIKRGKRGLALHSATGRDGGFTLPELLVAMAVMGCLAWTVSLIYFSVLGVYNQNMWRLRPYDEATKAVERVAKEIRGAMLIDTAGTSSLIVIMPQRDANRDNVLVNDGSGHLVLSQGDWVAYYLSDNTGVMGATGHCLWKAVKPNGGTTFVPQVKIAEDIHPELNPVDPATAQPRPMFTYWPDVTRLWGVEMWITSTSQVHGQLQPQTAHTECFLRNL